MDFCTIAEEETACVEDWINNREMKILNCMTHKTKTSIFWCLVCFLSSGGGQMLTNVNLNFCLLS